MDAIELISVYSTLFYVFLGITLLGLALAVFFFFYFDIPSVRAMMTGKAKRATIRRMEEQNFKTGNLRFQYPGQTGEMDKRGKTGRTDRSGKLAHSGRITPPEQAAPVPQPTGQPMSQSDETALLQEAAQTTVLQEAQAETTVLYAAAPTTVVNMEAPETSVLTAQPAPGPRDEVGQTAMLKKAPAGFRFDLTESTIVIHTDEIL